MSIFCVAVCYAVVSIVISAVICFGFATTESLCDIVTELVKLENMASETKRLSENGSDAPPIDQSAIRDPSDTLPVQSKWSKKESLRLQKQTYKMEKKKVENEFKMISQDPSVVILSDWLKVRNNLKNWSRLWCVLTPGMLNFYKNSKQKHWIGTVLLASVEFLERPSKKQGMCFKIYHILNQSIWTSKGPKGETAGLLTNPLPSNHVILRAQSDPDGQCWIDALELAKNCSNLLKKSFGSTKRKSGTVKDIHDLSELLPEPISPVKTDLADVQERLSSPTTKQQQLEGSVLSKVATAPCILEENVSSQPPKTTENEVSEQGYISSSSESIDSDDAFSEDESAVSSSGGSTYTPYVLDGKEELGDSAENTQSEELEGENKSLVWTLLKQVKPGMDLSKVVLPTFILEPRSFLDKLSDYYYHADLLAKAGSESNAFSRIKIITKWYLSGFYKKPKGPKKPYNPVLGEIFRCKWEHPDGTSSYYIAEQVSHHPPISAIAVINRQAGFTVHGSILARSKFYGNSLSAILDGNITVTLLNLGEEYVVTLPYAHCKGILYGKMNSEFGGKIKIKCEKTGYTTEVEFKLKSFFGGTMNELSGRILLGQRVLGTLSGHWDEEVHLTDLNKGSVENFWSVTKEIKVSRLQRYTVEPAQQMKFESANLWKRVSEAIRNKDQVAATVEKTILEEEQRKSAKQRKMNGEVWIPKYFEYNFDKDEWEYKYMDARPWDTLNDIQQVETQGIITTKTKHKTTPVRRAGLARGSNTRRKKGKQASLSSAGQLPGVFTTMVSVITKKKSVFY